jgi:hypothetical protein
MLRKNPKSQYLRYVRGGVKVFFVIEAVLFAASYGVWHRMNTSRGEWVEIGKRFIFVLGVRNVTVIFLQ